MSVKVMGLGLLAVLLAVGTAPAIEFHGVLELRVNMPVSIDSVFITIGGGTDTVHTPDWSRTGPGQDTFDFPDISAWPNRLSVFFRAAGNPQSLVIPNPVADSWYPMNPAPANVKFYSATGAAERPGARLPEGAFAVRPSVVSHRAVFELELAAAGPALVEVFDAAGNPVRRFDVAADVRSVSWDGADAAGKRLAEGVYFCRLTAGEAAAVRKILVAR